MRERHPGDVDVGGEECLQRDRRGELAHANEAARDVVDLAVNGLEEMLRFEKIRNAIECLVIDENSAEQSLLGFDIMGSGAIGGGRRRNRRGGCAAGFFQGLDCGRSYGWNAITRRSEGSH